MLDRCWLQRQVLQVFSYKLWEKSKAEVCMCVCTRACVRVSTCACVCVYVFYVIAKTSKYSRISHSQIETILENHHLKFSDKGSSPRQSPVPAEVRLHTLSARIALSYTEWKCYRHICLYLPSCPLSAHTIHNHGTQPGRECA